ncbi:MAG: SDR family oxidoreductase [Rhodobacteraceae bacterium]|nr:SDR family oxidoreductase [Paracoccaceae bacterium]MCY4196006.1 SDR family oxidoreductase [Paracoccaceae bacterium]
MNQTILITGASSGIGKTTAHHFQAKGWNVVATMRNPEDGAALADLPNVRVARLDVTDTAAIATAVAGALEQFSSIDVLVNNAGYGAYGPLENFDTARIRRQFDTNVIGVLDVTRAVLPHMRRRRRGCIVNISSIGGQMTFPLGTLYHGTKFAVEGLSEALHYELETVGIRVKIVQPGMIATDFAGRSFDFANTPPIADYQGIIQTFMAAQSQAEMQPSPPERVADVIWAAVTDGTHQLRYRAGDDAEMILNRRKTDDDATFIGGIKQQFGL